MFSETSNGRLPAEDGSVRPQTLSKCVSDDSRHFIVRRPRKLFDLLANFEQSFTPQGWLRSASNLAKTRFRRFPTFHFSTSQVFSKHVFSAKNLDFTNLSFWRSSDFFIRVGRCVVKSYCPNCPYFWGDFLGEGVKVVKRVFWLGFGPKMTLITSSCDVMIV